jgi:hypothetical protein
MNERTVRTSAIWNVARAAVTAAVIVGAGLVPGAGRALAATVFSDDFSGATLDPAWQVQPGLGTYSLVGGQLRYYGVGASAPYGWGSPSLALALPFTGTDWEIDIKATYNLYWLDSTGNSSGGQWGKIMVSFDPVSEYNDYSDISRRIDAWSGINELSASYGSTSAPGLLNPADATIQNNIADGTYWYQIIRAGGLLTINISHDGANYQPALSVSLSNPSGSYNELLLSGATYTTVGSYTDYDYVSITAAPEPGTWGIAVVGLLGLNWFGRRLKRRGARQI